MLRWPDFSFASISSCLASLWFAACAANHAADILHKDGVLRAARPADVSIGQILLREDELSDALRKGRFSAVYESGKRLLEESPSTRIAGIVGVAAAAVNDSALAKHLSTKAAEAREARADFNRLNIESILLKNERRFEAATGKITAALKIDTTDPVPHLTLAWVQLETEKYSDAEKTARQALALESKMGPAHTVLGAALYATGQFSKALQSYALARHASPEDWRPRFGIAEIMLVTGNFEESIKAARELLERHQGLPQIHTLLCRALMETGATAEAVVEAQKALALQPRSDAATFLLATAYARDNRLSEAFQTADESWAQDRVPFLLEIALWRLAAGHLSHARTALEIARHHAPGERLGYVAWGVLEQLSGNLAEAERSFQAAATSTNRASTRQAHFHSAVACLAARNWEAAARELASSGDYFPQPKSLRLDWPRLCAAIPPESFADLNLAVLLADQNLRKPALQAYELALGKAPENFLALYLSSKLYSKENKTNQCISALKNLLTLLPNYPPGYYALGDALLKKKEFTDAIAAFEKCTALDPANGVTFLRLGSLYASTAQPAKAIETFRRATELLPTSPIAFNELAVLLANDEERLTEASSAAAKALQLAPDQPAILDTVGWVELKRRQPRAAIARFQKASALASDPELQAAILYHTALAHEALGQRADAAAATQKALALSKSFGEADAAQSLLERLRAQN